ncbi:hypothetical protein AGDE_10757 [Angomonas deanei]|nr:hypothetical protein AGDE_10757 [Angomonas deanei]|eukprot:EPY27455.1 hypothetical protein AGDE_10757 [Angomonas deanei]
MDHHCPWINNCVGRDNTKFFLLFVSYIPLGAFHIVVTTLYSSFYHLKGVDMVAFDGDVVTTIVLWCSIIFSFSMGLAFGAFGGHFVWMAYKGESSMTMSIIRKVGEAKGRKMLQQSREDHLYDIFGSDRRWWVLACPLSPKRDYRGLPGMTGPTEIEMHHMLA